MTEPTAQEQEAWAAQFAVSIEQIRDAIRAVGPGKADVEMYLKGSHTSTDQDTTRAAG